MKNITTLLLVSIFLLTTTSASADYEEGEMKREGGEQHQMLPGVDDETKTAIKELHESMREETEALKESYGTDLNEEERAELRGEMDALRDAHHDEVIALLGDNTEAVAALEERKAEMEEKQAEKMAEREEMMEEREELLSTLDDDTRTALEELQADYKEAMANFKEVSPTDITKEESVERTAEYQEMKKTHQAAVAELLADYPAVLEAMNERKEDMGEKDGKMNRKGNGNMRGEKKGMYKKQFATKYQARLEKASDDKLVKVLGKIEVYIEKYENNDEITEERKENILAQLTALAEMIQEIVDAETE